MMQQAAEAVRHLHSAALAHGNLQPANIGLCGDVVKLLVPPPCGILLLDVAAAAQGSQQLLYQGEADPWHCQDELREPLHCRIFCRGLEGRRPPRHAAVYGHSPAKVAGARQRVQQVVGVAAPAQLRAGHAVGIA